VGHANGFKPKNLKSRIGELALEIPQVRGLSEGAEPFYPRSLERGLRSERALKLAVAEMYLQGVSTRRVLEVTKQLCGFEVSSSQVSRATALLDEELEAWRTRSLGAMPHLILDARYEKVRHGGKVVSCAVLWAIGVDLEGQRSVLGVSVSLSEAEVHWRDFLASLQGRGLHGVQTITSDDHAGLRAALNTRFPGVAWQRCQFHLQQNATAHIPRVAMRKEVAEDLRGVFNAPNRTEADRRLGQIVDKWRRPAPKLAEWMERDVPEGLTVFALPASHRRRLRTTNAAERVNLELRRRTRVAAIFPNEASLLRLVSALLSEISDDWESGRKYLTMEVS
jgi:transposase-like protein